VADAVVAALEPPPSWVPSKESLEGAEGAADNPACNLDLLAKLSMCSPPAEHRSPIGTKRSRDEGGAIARRDSDEDGLQLVPPPGLAQPPGSCGPSSRTPQTGCTSAMGQQERHEAFVAGADLCKQRAATTASCPPSIAASPKTFARTSAAVPSGPLGLMSSRAAA